VIVFCAKMLPKMLFLFLLFLFLFLLSEWDSVMGDPVAGDGVGDEEIGDSERVDEVESNRRHLRAHFIHHPSHSLSTFGCEKTRRSEPNVVLNSVQRKQRSH